jgi:dihydropteroate synthase
LVSQLINLSQQDVYKLYKEKYNLEVTSYDGLFGLEVRGIPSKLTEGLNRKTELYKNSPNIHVVNSHLFITGSLSELNNTIKIFDEKEASLLKDELMKSLRSFENYYHSTYKFGSSDFDFSKAYIMGILNVTPDSFSNGGEFHRIDDAINFAVKMLKEGADIIDIGGESTRPGSDPVSVNEELERVIPVIEKLLNLNEEVVISIDTTKVKVAEEALKCGAKIVNDISGGTFEPEIFEIAKEFDAGFVIMHIKGKPKTMQEAPTYSNAIEEVYDFLALQSQRAKEAGLKKIFIDPGIGFGKRVENNFNLINRLDDFKSLSFPVLIGLSRKSFIGDSLDLEIDERDDVSNALNCFAISKGARIIRTHNVRQGVQTCRLMNKIVIN